MRWLLNARFVGKLKLREMQFLIQTDTRDEFGNRIFREFVLLKTVQSDVLMYVQSVSSPIG